MRTISFHDSLRPRYDFVSLSVCLPLFVMRSLPLSFNFCLSAIALSVRFMIHTSYSPSSVTFSRWSLCRCILELYVNILCSIVNSMRVLGIHWNLLLCGRSMFNVGGQIEPVTSSFYLGFAGMGVAWSSTWFSLPSQSCEEEYKVLNMKFVHPVRTSKISMKLGRPTLH